MRFRFSLSDAESCLCTYGGYCRACIRPTTSLPLSYSPPSAFVTTCRRINTFCWQSNVVLFRHDTGHRGRCYFDANVCKVYKVQVDILKCAYVSQQYHGSAAALQGRKLKSVRNHSSILPKTPSLFGVTVATECCQIGFFVQPAIAQFFDVIDIKRLEVKEL